MLKQLFLVMFISLTASAFAQGINTGGGGPDGRNQQKNEDDINAEVKQQMIRTIRKDNDELMEEIKSAWSDCYTIKLKANDLIDLYAQLVIYSTGHGPEVRKKYFKKYGDGNCEKSKVYECFFKQQSIQNHIYGLVTRESYHYYLESKGIDKLESRQQLIKYYIDLMKGP